MASILQFVSCCASPGSYFTRKADKTCAFSIRKGVSFCGRIGNSSNQRYVSTLRCLEGPIGGDLGDKHKIENFTLVDEYALEAKLEDAIKSEDYVKAAELRDQLRNLQDDNVVGVRAANAKFYKAFETGNMKIMRDIWSQGENSHCIHPGAQRISGYDMVIASWELMLGPETALPLKIELHNLDVQVRGNMGYVTCLEVVRTTGSSWGKQLATNIFEKKNGIWYICMHHASHITI
ncbi:hypothetical protein KP509_1Z183100 [Ceratopteris richardii]|nr:hypothetical protein KP509_1Z183100 [Ceratopteris richardii]